MSLAYKEVFMNQHLVLALLYKIVFTVGTPASPATNLGYDI